MRTIPRRRLVATSALLAATTGLTTVVSPAQAAEGAPPVVVDDAVTVLAGRDVEVDLVANDTDPDGDSLAVCRIEDVPPEIFVFSDPSGAAGSVYIVGGRAGTYTFTYHACDHDYLTPGTVTVTVKPAPRIRLVVNKLDRPGRIKVRNRGTFAFHFLWGSWKARKEDGSVVVRPHTAKVVTVRRRSIIWFALNERRGAFRPGILRGIELPEGVEALPPGAPPRNSTFVLRSLRRSTWR